ncbi:c-type cytochrome [Flavobacterium suncheonense]|uniref:Cytochrome c domain-containing protein n=1 Tax=Flavobacterium suncheonense GH29-5 = DSM 17707 TaxID=1121899 RepID=A0A0A2LXZ4_9FLAO|nr:hypothetical protein Q764_14310 [Flavobacterium suncheonense GH29-5 = DSM 17707]
MKSLKKLTNKIIILCCVFLCLIISIFCFLLLNDSKKPKQIVTDNKPNIEFCGTKNSEIAHEGKTIFNNTCAACHKLDANMTGPALRNIDSIVFNKWLNNKNYKVNKAKIDQFGIDYHIDFTRKNFNESDLKMIYAYIGK